MKIFTVVGAGLALGAVYIAGVCTKCMFKAVISKEYRHAMVDYFDENSPFR